MDGGTKILAVLAIAAVFVLANYQVFLVQGDSMTPTFSTCTLVLVDNDFPPAQVATGDIVVVDVAGLEMEFDKIAHKVVENRVEEQLFSTRGDNSEKYEFPSSVDGFFGYDKFLGKVEHYYDLPEATCSLKGGD